jgi:hypothetical protein
MVWRLKYTLFYAYDVANKITNTHKKIIPIGTEFLNNKRLIFYMYKWMNLKENQLVVLTTFM